MANDDKVNMNPNNPQTGTGKNLPKGVSLRKQIEVKFKDKDGKDMPNSEKDAYDHRNGKS